MPHRFAQFLDDLRWALTLFHARRWRRGLGYGQRVKFDDAFRPYVRGESGTVLLYPEAIYHVSFDNLDNAIFRSVGANPKDYPR